MQLKTDCESVFGFWQTSEIHLSLFVENIAWFPSSIPQKNNNPVLLACDPSSVDSVITFARFRPSGGRRFQNRDEPNATAESCAGWMKSIETIMEDVGLII